MRKKADLVDLIIVIETMRSVLIDLNPECKPKIKELKDQGMDSEIIVDELDKIYPGGWWRYKPDIWEYKSVRGPERRSR